MSKIKKTLFFVLLLMGSIGLRAGEFGEYEEIYGSEISPTASGPRSKFSFEFINATRFPVWITILQKDENWENREEVNPLIILEHYPVQRQGFFRLEDLVLETGIDIRLLIYTSLRTRLSLNFDIAAHGHTIFVKWNGQLSSTGTQGRSPSGVPLGNNIKNSDIHRFGN